MTVPDPDQQVTCERYGVQCIGQPCETRLFKRCPYFDDLTGSTKIAYIQFVKANQEERGMRAIKASESE